MSNKNFAWGVIASVGGGAIITGTFIGSVVGMLIMLAYILKDK